MNRFFAQTDGTPRSCAVLVAALILVSGSYAKAALDSSKLEEITWPAEKEKPELYLKYDNAAIPGVEHLVLNGTTGAVTKVELDGLINYFLNRPLLTTNYQNTLFATWTRAYMMEWVYARTKDQRIVDRMIEQSRILLKYRDDNYGRYRVRISDHEALFVPGWNHFRGMVLIKDQPSRVSMGIAALGNATSWPAVTARLIAHHPDLWEKSYKGKSYRDIADEMLEMVHASWDFVIEHYYHAETDLLLSPAYGSEPEGYVPQWNRIFPIMASGNTLVDTYAALEQKNSKTEKIDRILQALFAEFWKYTRTEESNGKPVLHYPYGIYRWIGPKGSFNHTEDLNHLGFDARGFRVFVTSGRYMKATQLVPLANAMAEDVIKNDHGTFAKRLSSERVTENYSYWGALPPMIWLAELNPDLDKKLAEYVVGLMRKNNSLDARVVWHILSLREKRIAENLP